MDSMKCGKFVAELRRKKEWTQVELADRIGVTDKAVSRWETGKGYPDVSILKPLSDVLEVTVNELLSGERISLENWQDKAEEAIIHTLKEKKHILRMTNLLIFLISAFSLYISLKLFYNMAIFADERNSAPVLVCGGWCWLFMDWFRLALLAFVSVVSGIKLFTDYRK